MSRRDRRAPDPAALMANSAARQLSFIMLPSMSRLELTDDERDELDRALRGIVDGDRFPLSRRFRRLCRVLDKLEPPAAAVEPFPAPEPPAEPTHARRRRRTFGLRPS